MKISLTLKSTYGVTRAYPNCEASRVLASMLKTKTLTRDNLEHLKALGFEIETNAGLALADVQ